MIISKKLRAPFFFSFVFLLIFAAALYFFLENKPLKGTEVVRNTPVFNCQKGVPLSVDDKNEWGLGHAFSCYANYYRLLVINGGVPAAILDLKNRTKGDLYLEQRCHELIHTIGRTALENASSPAEAFAWGDSYCANGYYHGIMQELIRRRGQRNLSQEFLDSLCASLPGGKPMSPVDHVNCSHGIGHGIMYANDNEVFEALKTCDLLSNETEREPCWGGVFMENLLTDFKEHRTKYLNSEDLMFPCTAVEDTYKGACYTYQSSYIFKVTKSFEKTFATCRKFPKQYQDECFMGVGGNAATLNGTGVESTKNICTSAVLSEREQKSCVVGAIASIVFIRGSFEDGQLLCLALPENLQSFCSDSATTYYKLFHNAI